MLAIVTKRHFDDVGASVADLALTTSLLFARLSEGEVAPSTC